MYVKKERGYILIESIIILMIISFMLTLSLNIVSNNYAKSKVISISDDIKTLSDTENEFLYLANQFIKSDKDKYLNLINEASLKNSESKIYQNSKIRNYYLAYENKAIFIIGTKSNSKKYIRLNQIIEEDKIFLTPDFYKTDYMIL